MTLQTRSRYDDGHWSSWTDRVETVLDFHHQMATVRQTEVREKPVFEPGWYALRVGPYSAEVSYFEEQPFLGWPKSDHSWSEWRPLREWAIELTDNEESDDHLD